MSNKESDFWKAIPILTVAIVFISWGILWLMNNRVGVGFREEYFKISVVGGPLLILVGLVFLIVAYFSLSPFNKIRRFFEDRGKKRK